jgi:hypothetical protein
MVNKLMEMQFVLNLPVCNFSELNQATQLCPAICVQTVSLHGGTSVTPVAPEEHLPCKTKRTADVHILKIALKIII